MLVSSILELNSTSCFVNAGYHKETRSLLLLLMRGIWEKRTRVGVSVPVEYEACVVGQRMLDFRVIKEGAKTIGVLAVVEPSFQLESNKPHPKLEALTPQQQTLHPEL